MNTDMLKHKRRSGGKEDEREITVLSVISLDGEGHWVVYPYYPCTHTHTHTLLKFTRVVELLYSRKRNLCFIADS